MGVVVLYEGEGDPVSRELRLLEGLHEEPPVVIELFIFNNQHAGDFSFGE